MADRDLPALLAQLSAVVEAATPGPWTTNAHLRPTGTHWVLHDGQPLAGVFEPGPREEANAALIAALRNLVPEMITCVEASRAVVLAVVWDRDENRYAAMRAMTALDDALAALEARMREVLPEVDHG